MRPSSAPPSVSRLRIAVLGAGIGGLASASALRMAGHQVQLFERFAVPQPVGSGLVIQPVGQRVLSWLGVEARARSLGNPIHVLLGIEGPSGIISLRAEYGRGAPGRHGLGMHRASLFTTLYERVQVLGIPLITSAEIAAQTLRPGADLKTREIHLSDGRRFGPFDLVIDALGAHSPLTPLRSRPLPYGAVWTTLDYVPGAGPLPDHLTQRYRKARQMVGVLPIGRLPDDPTPRAAFFWSLRADQVDNFRNQPLAAWRAEVLSLWPEIAPYVDQIADHRDLPFAAYAHGTLYRHASGPVVKIGDAAHRTSPQLGQGANMALLDAAALTLALDEVPLAEAPALYAKLRRRHLFVYQGMSRFLTPQYQHDSRLLADWRDRVVAPLSRLWPAPWLMGRIAAGELIPPIRGIPRDWRPTWAAPMEHPGET